MNNQTKDNPVPEMLIYYRKQRRLLGKTVAKKTGYPIFNWETGLSNPTILQMKNLAELYKTDWRNFYLSEPSKKKSKYRNIKTEIDGVKFDSKKEADRYKELKLLEKAGEINDLKLQPQFELSVNGVKICTYKADFVYTETVKGLTSTYTYDDYTQKTRVNIKRKTIRVLEDVKGIKTPVYKLKKKLMFACYGIEIKET